MYVCVNTISHFIIIFFNGDNIKHSEVVTQRYFYYMGG